MQRIRGIDPTTGSIEHALLDHERCTAGALFAGLEHEHDIARERLAALVQQARSAQQHRNMQVVAAGVHPTVDLRLERQVVVFLNGQRIHVGTQQHRARGTRSAIDGTSTKYGSHRGQCLAQGDLQAEALQLPEHRRLCVRQIETDLGVTVQRVAHAGDLGGQGLGVGEEFVHHPSISVRWRRPALESASAR